MPGSTTSREANRRRVAARQAELRRQGLRPIQIGVPDARAPGFDEEVARQGRLVAQSADHEAMMAWIERNADWPEDDSDIPDHDPPR
jgi:hypothetical protein